jgi:hypothetical protein
MAEGKSGGNLDGILILAVIIVIMIIAPRDSSPSSGTSLFEFAPGTTVSSKNVKLGGGNASYAYQPYEEYITIENYGNSAVDLTGWQLKNGKDERSYSFGGSLQRFSADVAVLPTLVLGAGERAIVITGRVGVQTPYKITNFKENICTGYIEGHPDYAFTPPLTQVCPSPRNEPGIESLDRQCRRFVESLSSCRTPEFNAKDREGNPCSTCVNGEMLSSSCASYIKERFSYQGCLAYHSSDQNFSSGKTWRIFLGRGWEMWAEDYESIELFDSSGNLVDYQDY